MIFAERIDYNDPLYESYLEEAFNFKTKEEAERALKKVSNNEKELLDYINWGFKFGLTPVLIVGGFPIPIGMLIIQAFTTWLAFPGTAGDKLNKCNKIIKKCDRTLDRLSKKTDEDSKKMIAEYEKVRKHAVSEKEKYEKRVKDLGTFDANYNEAVVLTGNNGGSYMHDALYESYIQAKIDSEDRLAFALKESMVISEADYSNIRALQEAKLSDKIKAKWQKFVAFIKGLIDKFMESMSNILLDEKEYLEKYKDIILKKKPKEDMEYSYTGNYKEGINRLINTEVPLFDYTKYQKELEAEDDGALVDKIMTGKNFHYDDGETLPEQFKSYFLALEDGQQEGKFSDLNMTDIYNFCYNFNKIKGIVDKDINRLEASTKAIESAINKELNATGNAAAGDDVQKTETNTTTNTTNNSSDNKTSATNESVIFKEADGDNASNKDDKPKSTGLDIKASSDPTSKMQSTEKNTDGEKANAATGTTTAKEGNKTADDITKAANKWISVCNPLISAKLTACQQIAKDYMEIIRAHVRSYGGQDKKSKEGNKAPDKANKYSKNSDVAKAQQAAEQAKKDAETAESKNK